MSGTWFKFEAFVYIKDSSPIPTLGQVGENIFNIPGVDFLDSVLIRRPEPFDEFTWPDPGPQRPNRLVCAWRELTGKR